MKRKKAIKRAIDKWEEIEAELKEEHAHKHKGWWKNTYWIECGYCDHYESCPECALNRYAGEILVCSGDIKNEISYTYSALTCADKKDYVTALKYCRIVLRSMREDYQEEI